jgi:hypothetical protein
LIANVPVRCNGRARVDTALSNRAIASIIQFIDVN